MLLLIKVTLLCIDDQRVRCTFITYENMGEWQKIERKNVENRGGTKHVGATVRCGKWRLYFRHFSFRYFSFRSFATISKIFDYLCCLKETLGIEDFCGVV